MSARRALWPGDNAVPSLFVFRGNDQGLRVELTDDMLGLGRDTANQIQLHDTEVSRRHAVLRRTDKTYMLSDLGSSNGTYVNGQRVDAHRLASGDQLQIGNTQLLYTQTSGDSGVDLAQKIDIITGALGNDRSRIVSAISQEDGSRLFDPDSDMPPHLRLARGGSNLQIIYRTALAASHTLDIDELLDRIMRLIFDWVEADRGCIMLMDPETKQLTPKVRRNRRAGGKEDSERITISQTILDYCMERNEGVLTSDAQEDERWNPAASIVRMGVREAICAPLTGRYGVVGVIYIDTLSPPQALGGKTTPNKFNDEHLKLLIAIARQAALAVEDTQYYSAMVEAERLAAIGQTIATLSHHIKNILQGIRGGSFLIKEGLAQHNETMVGKGWEFVERNQQRISTLVMDMLTFSKERQPDLERGDLNQIVADVVELMVVRAAEKQVELICEPNPRIPPLVFDNEGIHRAVLNVVTNAIDACYDTGEEEPTRPGRVVVSTEYLPDEKLARVVIADNGPGIAPEEVKNIFTLFVSHKGSRGTGLGLPVSEKIMKEHGGRILLDSQVGEGSRFTLEMPANLPDAVRETAAHDAP